MFKKKSYSTAKNKVYCSKKANKQKKNYSKRKVTALQRIKFIVLKRQISRKKVFKKKSYSTAKYKVYCSKKAN